MNQHLRKTKIVCTIGPASQDKETLKKLLKAGMNVARFNFSHGTHEEMRMKMNNVREASKETGLPVSLMMDTKGPEIRLRDFENGAVILKDNTTFVLTTEEILGNEERATISYKNLKSDVHVGETLLVDDGNIELKIKDIKGEEIITEVIHGGRVSNHKGINAPGTILSMPYLSDVDISDILFGIEMDVDCIAISFVRCADDVREIRKLLDEHGSKMKIISKIENNQGIDNLSEIMDESDGIMVARGDMGVEIPFERLPHIQKDMIAMANQKGVFTITATQMLESMIHNSRPTRAEIADVANAVYDGTSAVMLSGETAAGQFPVEAVKTMAKIAKEAETHMDFSNYGYPENPDITVSAAYAACMAAECTKATAIIAVTATGYSAFEISRFRPSCPILACTFDSHAFRQLPLYFGVTPLMIEKEENIIDLFRHAIDTAKNAGYLKAGDKVVVVAGVPVGSAGNTNTIHIATI